MYTRMLAHMLLNVFNYLKQFGHFLGKLNPPIKSTACSPRGVALYTDLVLTFDEEMVKGTGNITIMRDDDPLSLLFSADGSVVCGYAPAVNSLLRSKSQPPL